MLQIATWHRPACGHTSSWRVKPLDAHQPVTPETLTKAARDAHQPSNRGDTYKCMTGPVISAPGRTGKRGGAGGGIWDDKLCLKSAGHRH